MGNEKSEMEDAEIIPVPETEEKLRDLLMNEKKVSDELIRSFAFFQKFCEAYNKVNEDSEVSEVSSDEESTSKLSEGDKGNRKPEGKNDRKLKTGKTGKQGKSEKTKGKKLHRGKGKKKRS